ncbi:MAG: MBL fold metallo-hydrolase [Chloroflexi bacterium]|nr:MBL fold metallo-hydrolase [Chloroflexota bacterium]
MNIRFLGAHNLDSCDSKFTCLLIDDALALDAGALTSSLSLEAQQRLKAILLTHQHYDHVADLPALALNLFFQGAGVSVYSSQRVYDALATHLLNGELYPKFLDIPEGNPTVKFSVIEPNASVEFDGYRFLALPLNHTVPAYGYQITSPRGKTLFYTGDTGGGLAACWEHISPQLIVIEVTAPNRYKEFAQRTGHLTPDMLKQELTAFRQLKGYIPTVVVVHVNPSQESEIGAETALVAEALDASITVASEGMDLCL